jgi:phosphate transport system permease protein
LKTQVTSHIDNILKLLTTLAFACCGLLLAVIIIGLVYSGIRAGSASVLSAFSSTWSPESGVYGIVPMMAGSLLTAILATAAAIPLSFGILSCMWLYDNAISHSLRALLRFMSGIPTVLYAFCGLFILVPFIRNAGMGAGYGILTVSIVLCLLILPTMTILADAALAQLGGLDITAAALGISREKAFLHVAIPARRKALLSALLLSFSRALGDTMVALMLAGNSAIMPEGLFASVRTLSSHISLLTATEITAGIEFTMFLAGFLLFLMALLLSVVAHRLRAQ